MSGPGINTNVLQDISRNERFAKTRELMFQLDDMATKMSSSDRADLIAARDLSFSVHIQQKDRPDGSPYINHPLRVTLVAASKFGVLSRDALIAGLLHDSVEDQPNALIERLGGSAGKSRDSQFEALRLIEQQFGGRVSQIVGQLTNPNFQAMTVQAQLRGDTRSDAELKNHFYKEHFFEILEKDPTAFLIKLADFSENAFALGNLNEGEGKDRLREKYGPVILALRERLEAVPTTGHVLSVAKQRLSNELTEVYERDYSAAK